MVWRGPWVQPDDTDGVISRSANRQSIQQTFTGTVYPAFPPPGSTPVTSPQGPGWDIGNVLDPFTGTLTQWVWVITEWVLAIDVQYQIDTVPSAVMPPVSPAPTDSTVTGVEYEAAAGAPLGPVTIRFPNLAALTSHRFPDVTSTAPLAETVDNAIVVVRSIATADYTWDRSGAAKPVLSRWWTGPDIAAQPIITGVSANPGSVLVPGLGGTPTDTWYGSDGAGNAGNNEVDVDIVTTLADLDGGSYAAIAAVDTFVTGTTPMLPNSTSGGSGIVSVRQLAGFADAFTQIQALVRYRPPRYRWVHDARPPLAHRQRRDGAATAGPQLAHIGTTGGRPPLAWRQNNP